MASTIASDALWSDVTVPDAYTARPFHRWLLDHGLDPNAVLLRGALHGDNLVGIEVWAPRSPQTPDPTATPNGAPRTAPLAGEVDPLAWPADGTVFTLQPGHEADDDAIEDLGETLQDSMLVPYTVEPQAAELAPQAWRVLAFRAHWENERIFTTLNSADDHEPPFQLSRVSSAGQRHPLDRADFVRVRESFLGSRHLSSMSMEQYHAWFGRSLRNLGADGGLSESVTKDLHERLNGEWQHQDVGQQQEMARRRIKPHPLHEHLMVQAIERWHLQRSLGDAHTATAPDERSRPRL